MMTSKDDLWKKITNDMVLHLFFLDFRDISAILSHTVPGGRSITQHDLKLVFLSIVTVLANESILLHEDVRQVVGYEWTVKCIGNYSVFKRRAVYHSTNSYWTILNIVTTILHYPTIDTVLWLYIYIYIYKIYFCHDNILLIYIVTHH